MGPARWCATASVRDSGECGLYDPSLVQKFVFTRPLAEQALFTGGDWKDTYRFTGQALYRLHVIPMNMTAVLGLPNG